MKRWKRPLALTFLSSFPLLDTNAFGSGRRKQEIQVTSPSVWFFKWIHLSERTSGESKVMIG
jgi:hypothetical protein